MATIAESEGDIAETESQLVEYKQRLEELRVEAAGRLDLEQRQQRLAESLADPIFADRTRWDRERTWVEGRQGWVKSVLDSLPESIPPRTEVPIDIDASSAKAVLEKVREALDQILESGRDGLNSLRGVIAKAVSELEGYRDEWDSAFEVAESEFRARLAELGAADLAEAAAEKRGVDEKVAHIMAVIEPDIAHIESAITSLRGGRAVLLQKLANARLAIAQSRSVFVEELNTRLGGSVLVDLSSRDTSLFFDALDTPLQGSKPKPR
jgi:hypothetical protein